MWKCICDFFSYPLKTNINNYSSLNWKINTNEEYAKICFTKLYSYYAKPDVHPKVITQNQSECQKGQAEILGPSGPTPALAVAARAECSGLC